MGFMFTLELLLLLLSIDGLRHPAAGPLPFCIDRSGVGLLTAKSVGFGNRVPPLLRACYPVRLV